MTSILRIGNSKQILKSYADNTFDSICTDPPYGLTSIVKRFGKNGSAPAQEGTDGRFKRLSKGFMGEEWDGTGIEYDPEFWRECLRVLKPGGHVLALSSTRTYHRMATAIDDAGFEIRDMLQWIYAQGYPKSHNLEGDFEGWGTSLKPACEPICLARKPIVGTVKSNVARYGTGALNIDATRIPGEDIPINKLEQWSGFGEEKNPDYIQEINDKGRWPSNVMLDQETADGLNGRARFFFVAKVSKAERNEGLGGMETKTVHRYGSGIGGGKTNDLPSYEKNTHPTVKPLALMRELCKLITPPNGTILDPFVGSGTTGCAAVIEGFNFVGIDNKEEYINIARKRIDHYTKINQLQPSLLEEFDK